MPSFDSPLFWLAIVTFVIVLGVAFWSWQAVARRQKYGKRTEGIGGPDDPMA